MQMFKVQHKQESFVINVYATKTNSHGDILFLTYDESWKWKNSIEYKPYNT